jgi:hypothetical protein
MFVKAFVCWCLYLCAVWEKPSPGAGVITRTQVETSDQYLTTYSLD